ncbi:ubiquitin-conjugating enzyme [Diaporthe helianthi]|uniref:Ubiquitin-conjugating enzyme n=1 Tax=Diaporthe helianthi TaxID=158607 RepID=A0A2P5HJJ0_DIAHE|nr:ubiquitin-conjugating enzyme [Diaporthe helianthi]
MPPLLLPPPPTPTTLAIKRMAKERRDLEEASNQEEDQDYFVVFQDDNLLQFDAYVIAPDTIYRYRLVKLHFEITNEYPLKPPKVTFIQHTGYRIHPNLYPKGLVCLSILGTWQGEPWAFGMTCHAVLITIRSLLDDEPYKHEPGQNDNPNFNRLVEYTTWRCLLLDYLAKETDPAAKAWLDKYVHKNGQAMLRELSKLQEAAAINKLKTVRSPYASHLPDIVTVDYPAMIKDVQAAISAVAARQEAKSADNPSQPPPKRKASDHQATTKAGASEIDDEQVTAKKRAKTSVAANKQSGPEIVDLT